MFLIVGLGNPGAKYQHNRHNIGFLTADEIARCHRFGPAREKFQGQICEGEIRGAGQSHKCLLLKPMTYMNESGRSVGEAARFYKIPPEDIIVLYDEIDLAPGKLRAKAGGGFAGHNGLRSIGAHLGADFWRVRIGVGHPGDKNLVSRYVLSDFSKDEKSFMGPLVEAIARHLGHLLDRQPNEFLNRVNTDIQPPKPARKDSPTKGQDTESK